MATERTVIEPTSGVVITFEVEDEQYQQPFGGVTDGTITAAAGGGDAPNTLTLLGVG